MPKTGGISRRPSVPGSLGDHRDRITDLERNRAGLIEGPWHIVGDPDEPPYEDSWVNDTADNEPVTAFQRVGTRVYLRGAVTGGVDGTTVFTLPAGYRPVGEEPYITDLEPQGITKVRVFPDGSVKIMARLADVV